MGRPATCGLVSSRGGQGFCGLSPNPNLTAGPNGCGKSTLLRLVMGREKPISGRVELGPHHINPNYFQQNQARGWWWSLHRSVSLWEGLRVSARQDYHWPAGMVVARQLQGLQQVVVQGTHEERAMPCDAYQPLHLVQSAFRREREFASFAGA